MNSELSLSDFYPEQTPAKAPKPEQPTPQQQTQTAIQTTNSRPPTDKDIKILTRQIKVIQYRAQGLTIPQICKKLQENDKIQVSEHTIWFDLHSDTAEDFVDELIRQQITDINTAEKTETRLTFRQNLIETLKPNKKPAAVEVNVSQQQANITPQTNALIEFSRRRGEQNAMR